MIDFYYYTNKQDPLSQDWDRAQILYERNI